MYVTPAPLRFYLGVHRPNWLADSDVRLFVARQAFGKMARLPRAKSPWALDSGGFTELNLHGRWTRTAREYAADVRWTWHRFESLNWRCQKGSTSSARSLFRARRSTTWSIGRCHSTRSLSESATTARRSTEESSGRGWFFLYTRIKRDGTNQLAEPRGSPQERRDHHGNEDNPED